MASKIEELIDELEEYIDHCKPVAFSSKNISVNKDDMDSLIAELRTRTPEEIRKYQKIISSKEAILADARSKADSIISQAQIQTNELVSEHQIMQQAYAQANEVIMLATKTAQEKIDNATAYANEIRLGAVSYADELLTLVQDVLAGSIETTRRRDQEFIGTLQQYLDIVEANRAVLNPSSVPTEQEQIEEFADPVPTAVAEEEAAMIEEVSNAIAQEVEDTVSQGTVNKDVPDEFFN